MVSGVINCSICRDPLEEGQVVQLNCQHEFHRSCIDTWIGVCRRNSRAPSCPLDRSRITAINGEPLENSNAPSGGREEIDRLYIVPILNSRIYNQRIQEAFNRLERHNQSLHQRIEEIFNRISLDITPIRRLEMGHDQRIQQISDEFRSSFVSNVDYRVQEMQGQADSSSEEAGILSPEPQRNNMASPSTLGRIAQIATDLISMVHERITEWRNRYLADPVP